MNQEKIGQLIKEIRKKNNLSQQKFAEKYGVTYQAVSKWENGKNIPDISTLKQICEDHNINLNDLLEAKNISHKKKYIIPIIIISIILIILVITLIIKNNDKNFEFKTLSTTCNDFNIHGSIAYNENKTSIYISHVDYCGKENNIKYNNIKCILYESNNKIKKEVSKYNSEENTLITLEEFLKNVKFNVDNYEKTCKIYSENSLYLEIEAIDENQIITTYKVPLKLEENCKK